MPKEISTLIGLCPTLTAYINRHPRDATLLALSHIDKYAELCILLAQLSPQPKLNIYSTRVSLTTVKPYIQATNPFNSSDERF